MKTNLINSKTAISTVVIALVAIVVVAAVAGSVYFAATQNKPSSPSASESPIPSVAVSQSPTPLATTSSDAPTGIVNPSTSALPTVAPSSAPTTGTSASAAPNVAGASSLQFSVSLSADTAGALRGNYTYYGKNAGTSSFMMRIDYTIYSTPSTIILNGAQQKAWSYSDGKWTDISASYNSYNGVWNPLWQGYVAVLASWNGIGDYSYTVGAATIRIYDINVNPVLADSLFQHS
jgi:hypothetical protein